MKKLICGIFSLGAIGALAYLGYKLYNHYCIENSYPDAEDEIDDFDWSEMKETEKDGSQITYEKKSKEVKDNKLSNKFKKRYVDSVRPSDYI